MRCDVMKGFTVVYYNFHITTTSLPFFVVVYIRIRICGVTSRRDIQKENFFSTAATNIAALCKYSFGVCIADM